MEYLGLPTNLNLVVDALGDECIDASEMQETVVPLNSLLAYLCGIVVHVLLEELLKEDDVGLSLRLDAGVEYGDTLECFVGAMWCGCDA